MRHREGFLEERRVCPPGRSMLGNDIAVTGSSSSTCRGTEAWQHGTFKKSKKFTNELWLMNKETCFACLFLMNMNTQGPGHGVLYTLY